MKQYFVDSNVFIRYLTNDVPEQADRVERLLILAEKGKIKLVTGPPVFFELAWTLKSFYKLDRESIYRCLLSITAIKGLEVLDTEIVISALELYRKAPVEFADAYISVLSKKLKADGIVTFNRKHFEKLNVKLYSI